MKDQVPVVLLNQWLDVEPEKSRFANKDCCLADEYSVYSDETMSQALSIKGNSIKKIPKVSKRNSYLQTEENQLSVFDKLRGSPNRRMTIKNRDLLLDRNIASNWDHVIKEVDDLSNSDTSDLERSSRNPSVNIEKRDKNNQRPAMKVFSSNF